MTCTESAYDSSLEAKRERRCSVFKLNRTIRIRVVVGHSTQEGRRLEDIDGEKSAG